MSNIGNNLKELLKDEGISENELAKRTGISQQIINRLIAGINTNPKLETIIPIANYFRIPLQDLISTSPISNTIQDTSSKIPFVDFKNLAIYGIEAAINQATKFISADIEKNKFYFATNMYDDSMEPKFSKGTILVLEKTSKVFSGDFCLIKSDDNHYSFRQIMINSQDKKFTKCLNAKWDEYNAMPLSINYYVLAILLESRTIHST